MTRAEAAGRARERAAGLFALGTLAAMALALSYVRFRLLPAQAEGAPVAFHWRNPMLDAVPGERILSRPEDDPSRESCLVVREEGVVVRPFRGPEAIRQLHDLRHSPAYLACSVRDVDRSRGGCGGPELEHDVLLFGLNHFGMPFDTHSVPQALQPERVRWGDRTTTVLRATLQRYGLHEAIWSVWLANEAPVTGTIRVETVRSDGRRQARTYSELLPGPEAVAPRGSAGRASPP